MKVGISRPPHYYTSSEWINKREIVPSGWPVRKKARHLGHINAGGTNMAKSLLARLEKEGRLK